jgi:hypothetical protein
VRWMRRHDHDDHRQRDSRISRASDILIVQRWGKHSAGDGCFHNSPFTFI